MFQIIQYFKKNKKIKKYTLLFLTIFALLLISHHIYKTIHLITNKNYKYFHNTGYLHTSNEIIINIYNTTGNLKYKLTTNHIQYSPNHKLIKLIQPNIIILNEKNATIWEISCNQAELNDQKTLNLQGYVHVKKIENNIHTQSMITHHLFVHFTNQEITSTHKTIIHGYRFYSIGLRAHIDLKTQTTQLFDKVYTQYETK